MSFSEPTIERLCERILQLEAENSALRALVLDIAMHIPTDWMDEKERTLLDSITGGWFA